MARRPATSRPTWPATSTGACRIFITLTVEHPTSAGPEVTKLKVGGTGARKMLSRTGERRPCRVTRSLRMIPVASPLIGSAEREAVDRVLASGLLAQGAEVAAFEHEFAALVEDRHCIAVNSGTSALHLGMLAAGIRRGDEVIVPSFTFAATANAVRLCGAVPVFVDIDPVSFCIDPAAVLAAVTSRTTAVLAVHLFGHPADMPALSQLCSSSGLLLIEDA